MPDRYFFAVATTKTSLKDLGRDLTEDESDRIYDIVNDYLIANARAIQEKLELEFPEHDPKVVLEK